eukprot:4579355-Pyramimonas_sp.AAC.1
MWGILDRRPGKVDLRWTQGHLTGGPVCALQFTTTETLPNGAGDVCVGKAAWRAALPPRRLNSHHAPTV